MVRILLFEVFWHFSKKKICNYNFTQAGYALGSSFEYICVPVVYSFSILFESFLKII